MRNNNSRSAGKGARSASATMRRLLGLPPRWKRRIAGPAIRRDGLELDLDTQMLLRISSAWPRPRLDPVTSPPRMRAAARRMAGISAGRAEPMPVTDSTVAGAETSLPARVYTPAGAGDTALVWFHGGGWVAGDLDTHDRLCRTLAAGTATTVVSVAYRLAPEHPYPAPVEDACAAYADIVARAAEFGAAPDRIAVGGDSAGGYLAALVAQHTVDRDTPDPLAQLLLYPVTDLTGACPSRQTLARGFDLTRTDLQFFDRCFLPPTVDRAAPGVSPLAAPTLTGVAPALIVTAGFDPLRDEGSRYAQRLREHGVPVTEHRFDGYTHGFANNGLAFGPAVRHIAELFAATLAGSAPQATTALP
ncbi:alpha/beta hydrolase [Nocardia asteroides]|uniref:alpha/beta hydrolase n=1 Tax=Nocardia asteroides TaxID=1824 RepID=UPI001E4599CC|nr:alpha/beta hydrolase [Nocardia asteroides]UGT60336.1 alpha/beta hydrolase [Nocardia asteroides]